MCDLFISPRGRLLQNWATLSDRVSVHEAVSDVFIDKDTACIFWLHSDANSEQWLAKCIHQIHAGFYNARIAVLANVPQQADAITALRLGAAGYCHAYSATEVLSGVKAVISNGGVWLGQDLLQHLIGVSRTLITAEPASVMAALELLTLREREVALQAAIGLSNKAIARLLGITERTVKAHLSSSFERLGVKDRLQLALVLNRKTASQAAPDLPAILNVAPKK